jgi:hypothetical protein
MNDLPPRMRPPGPTLEYILARRAERRTVIRLPFSLGAWLERLWLRWRGWGCGEGRPPSERRGRCNGGTK